MDGPIAVGPVGLQKAVHPDGELAMAEGAARAGSLLVVAVNATTSIDDIAAAQPALPLWFQLYNWDDRDALAAVVSEGAGERSVREFLSGVSGPDWLALPQYAALTSAVALFGNDTPPPGLESLAGEVEQPLLLIYGEHGQHLERTLNPKYAAAAGDGATLWEVPGSGHMGGLDAQPAEYERRVVGFLDGALG